MVNRISLISYKVPNNTRRDITFSSNSDVNFANDKLELKNQIGKATIGAMGLSFLAGGVIVSGNIQKISLKLGLASALILLGLLPSFPIYSHLDKLDIKKQK